VLVTPAGFEVLTASAGSPALPPIVADARQGAALALA
jgi:hypothetical protein